jgi:integrase/recombinase XerD
MTTSDLDDYAQWMTARGLSPSTVAQRRTFAARLMDEWGTLNRSPVDVAGWLRAYHGWTARTYLRHLRSIYAWAVETGRVQVSPVERYRTPPTPRPKPKPLTSDEWAAAMRLADERTRAWLLLGKLAGLRAHEIAKVHGRDVDEGVIFVHGKGGQEALIPTHPALWTLARSYPRDGYWFPSPQQSRDHVHSSLVGNTIRDLFRSVGITHGAAHRLRATYGTELRRAGADVRIIQELLRHRSLATTEHYLGVEASELAAAVRRLAA